ncbi:MAG: HDOD domain-containing protein [Dechloromonas sp.]|uniref:HDOD domain-containing protein n=1 Tax=Candidatus Dechloromonas phosphorivorans TaxID=2899244 RepID=A0A935MRX7_9RHOO|nr:HDOD domain-containing protein [Candidatus Dechloromonas phosphorivorans]
MAYDLVEAVLISGASLPSPGVALIKLQTAAQDDNAGIREFANAVESDPAVCGALMRVANSAVLRPPRKSTTVEQAISVIGFSRTLAVTASVCLKSQAELLKGELRAIVEAIFDASNRAAEFSYLVARNSSQRRLGDSAYLGSLMQDTGIIMQAKRGQAVSLESAELDTEHAAISAHLIRNWKMPNDVAAAVAVHHTPREAEKLGGDICAIACLLAAGRRLRDGETDAWQAWAEPVEKTLNTGNDELAEILANVESAES